MSETYFKTLNRSSKFFLELSEKERNPIKRKSFALSVVINSWVLLEAYCNYLSEILAKANIETHERALLRDRELRLNDDGRFIEIRSRSPTLKRILFILNNFSTVDIKKFKKTEVWNRIKICEEVRNDLIHPKRFTVGEKITIKKAQRFREDIVCFIKLINKKVLHKSIILD